MNGVIGMAELLLRSPPCRATRAGGGDQHQRRGPPRAVDDILDLSKIEASRLELQDTDLELRVLVESILRLLTPRATAKGLALHCEIAPRGARAPAGRRRPVAAVLLTSSATRSSSPRRGRSPSASSPRRRASGSASSSRTRDRDLGEGPGAALQPLLPGRQHGGPAVRGSAWGLPSRSGSSS